jgi:hypothetical protein
VCGKTRKFTVSRQIASACWKMVRLCDFSATKPEHCSDTVMMLTARLLGLSSLVGLATAFPAADGIASFPDYGPP